MAAPEEEDRKSWAFKLDDRIHVLGELALVKIGQRLSNRDPLGMSNWKALGDKLGYDMHELDTFECHEPRNPGFQLLKHWQQKKGSTLAVLNHSLQELQRNDVQEMLYEYMKAEFTLTVCTKDKNGEGDIHSVTVKGNYTLEESVGKYLEENGMDKSSMEIIGPECDELNENQWKLKARSIKGQQLTLKRKEESLSQPEQESRVETESSSVQAENSTTLGACAHTLKLVFPPDPPDKDRTPVKGIAPTVSPKQKNLCQHSYSLERNLTGSTSSIGAEPVYENTQNKDSDVDKVAAGIESIYITHLEGWFPNLGNKENEIARVLGPYLRKDGSYLCRPIDKKSVAGAVGIAISVVHLGKVKHFCIKEVMKDKRKTYYIGNKNESCNSLEELIKYHYVNAINCQRRSTIDSSSLQRLGHIRLLFPIKNAESDYLPITG